MLREKPYLLRQMNVGVGLLLVAASFFVRHLLRTRSTCNRLRPDPAPRIVNYLWLLPVAAVVVVASRKYNGHYLPSARQPHGLTERLTATPASRRPTCYCRRLIFCRLLAAAGAFDLARQDPEPAAARWALIVAKNLGVLAMLRARRRPASTCAA
jgi:hypothetical protein